MDEDQSKYTLVKDLHDVNYVIDDSKYTIKRVKSICVSTVTTLDLPQPKEITLIDVRICLL